MFFAVEDRFVTVQTHACVSVPVLIVRTQTSFLVYKICRVGVAIATGSYALK